MSDIGSFHVGGTTVTLSGLSPRPLTVVPGSPTLTVPEDGDFAAWSMYAQYVRLVRPRAPYPVLLWHGGGMTGTVWETTPDGRPGWQHHFLSSGFDVLVSDAVERGRAGWPRYPQVATTEPFFLPKQAAWTLFRIGPEQGYATQSARRRAFEGTQFPVEAFDTFTKQIVPRWTGHEAHVQAGYDALLEKVGASIIVGHSQASNFALAAALRHPDRVKCVVLLEPGGVPELREGDLQILRSTPILIVWGDRVGSVPFWQHAHRASGALCSALQQSGAAAELWDLPNEGVRGNSHMLMMDRNSDEIAFAVEEWLVSQLRLVGT